MQTPPLGPFSSQIRREKVIEMDSNSEDYDHQCTFTPQRRVTRSNTLNKAKKSNSEGVHDDSLHQSPFSSDESGKDESVEDLSDTEDYSRQCKVTPQRRWTRKYTMNQAKKSNSQNDQDHDNLLPQPLLSSEESGSIELLEELGEFEDFHIPRSITRHIRGTRNNMRNQTRKLDSDRVHDYLVNLWHNFPEDKMGSFAHIDPLWYTIYSDNSNKERVLSWIKKKDVFSRKYVVFPIVQWNHWSVLIFCHLGESLGSIVKTPCILLLDSLEKTDHSKQLEPIIRRFVSDLYESLEMTEDIKMLRKLPFLVPKVPQQRDGEECGYFVLYYIKLFVQNAPENFSISDGYPYFMKEDWFTYDDLDSFCKLFDSSHK